MVACYGSYVDKKIFAVRLMCRFRLIAADWHVTRAPDFPEEDLRLKSHLDLPPGLVSSSACGPGSVGHVPEVRWVTGMADGRS